jgi:DNA-directed RNA polymerase subunit K/omega
MLEYKNKQLNNYSNKNMDKEKKINFFDPVANAYREIPASLAKKYVDGLKKIKEQLEKIKK